MLCKQDWEELYDYIRSIAPLSIEQEPILQLLLSGRKLIKEEVITDKEGKKIKRIYKLYDHKIEEVLLMEINE